MSKKSKHAEAQRRYRQNDKLSKCGGLAFPPLYRGNFVIILRTSRSSRSNVTRFNIKAMGRSTWIKVDGHKKISMKAHQYERPQQEK